MVWPEKMKSPQYTWLPLMDSPNPDMILTTRWSTSALVMVWFSCESQWYSLLAEGSTVTIIVMAR